MRSVPPEFRVARLRGLVCNKTFSHESQTALSIICRGRFYYRRRIPETDTLESVPPIAPASAICKTLPYGVGAFSAVGLVQDEKLKLSGYRFSPRFRRPMRPRHARKS